MKVITRNEAIDAIRGALLDLVDDESSLCQVADRLGIFCGGFSQWSLDELKQRFPWIVDRHPDVGRAELERLANRWCLTRQSVEHGRVPCDLLARAPARKPCAGWEEFYEAEIAGFHRELLGEEVKVVPEALAPRA